MASTNFYDARCIINVWTVFFIFIKWRHYSLFDRILSAIQRMTHFSISILLGITICENDVTKVMFLSLQNPAAWSCIITGALMARQWANSSLNFETLGHKLLVLTMRAVTPNTVDMGRRWRNEIVTLKQKNESWEHFPKEKVTESKNSCARVVI